MSPKRHDRRVHAPDTSPMPRFSTVVNHPAPVAGALLPYERYWVPYASQYNPHALDVGDLDDDGNNDIALADYNHGLVIPYYREIMKACLPLIVR